MLLIPVIDLLQGQVVHARRGERENYRPIQSSLCKSSEADEIVASLIALHSFSCLYIADLNAIQSNGGNINIINKLHNAFANLTLWLDAGVSDTSSYKKLAAKKFGRIVIGSETLQDLTLLNTHHESKLARSAPILSLDFQGDQFRGETTLQNNPKLWPDDVIAMTLARVGANSGPDFERLAQLIQLAQQTSPHKKIYAAGGVRHVADLYQLRDMGVTGALVASALHDGRITRADLQNFSA
jgi:phosphoribosylformimino-5-aminoimidazole carboxamide ribotide isomerase